jgi:lipoprotein signal peptidase
MLASLFVLYETFKWSTFLLVVVIYTITDALYTKWMYQVTKRQPWHAAVTAMVLAACIAFGVLSYTSNHLYIIAVILGSGIGTYLVVSAEAAIHHKR